MERFPKRITKPTATKLSEELIQIAAVAIQMIESFDRNE